METILATVTVISLALAGVMGGLLARLVREERRRSDARVALLTELAATHEPGDLATSVRRERAGHAATVVRPVISADEQAGLGDLKDFDFRETEPAPSTSTSGILFAEEEKPSAWPLRIGAATAVIAVVAGLAFAMRTLPDGEPAATEEQVVASESMPPLELLSLAHRQHDGSLTISGLVQNPRGGKPLSRVEAAVLALDNSGQQIASGRAPIDFTTLSPGDESPFIVRVSAKNVARYRVSFKGEGDQPLAHVDRRHLDSLARKELP